MINNNASTNKIRQIVTGKRILYIATKNRDYLRLEQEILLLKKYATNVDIIVSSNKIYIFRILYVYWNLIFYISNYEVVFIGFAPQLILPFFKWKFKNKIIIIDFFISLYDTFIFDRKKFLKNSIPSKIIKKFDKLTLDYSKFIICDTKEHSKYFRDEFNVSPEKMIVLYLNADPKYYYPMPQIKPEKLTEKFIVIYFGSALPLQGVDIILEAITKINLKEIYFIIIGPIKNELKLNQKNVIFIEWLSQKELSKYIAFSDLCLAGHFNNRIAKAKRVIPGKAYIYEAMKKKIILGDNNANKERYPHEYDNVSFVKMGDSDKLAKLILHLYRDWQVSHKL